MFNKRFAYVLAALTLIDFADLHSNSTAKADQQFLGRHLAESA